MHRAGAVGRAMLAGAGAGVVALALVAAVVVPSATASSGESAGELASGAVHAGTSAKQSAATASGSSATRAVCNYDAKLVPSCRLAFGAYSLPTGSENQIQAFASFENMIGRRLDIVHLYKRGTDKFPNANEREFATRPARDRVLLINWKPENGLSWAQVAAGQGDSWIDAEARYIKANFTPKFYLTIHHEPEEEVRGAGSGFTAKDYARMYRHVVQRFRAAGVTNAVYVMNYMGAQKWAPIMPDLWPGAAYVDWLAFDPYLTSTAGTQVGTFARLMNLYWGGGDWRGEYRWARKYHPHKPIMLAEWGIGEKPGDGSWKATVFRSVIRQASDFPHLKALVYFSNPQGASGDARANTSTTSLAGFKEMATSQVFLDH